jgi:hypothetical protein
MPSGEDHCAHGSGPSEIIMPATISLSFKAPNGLAFEISDHMIIRGWADLHNYLAAVRLDHGLADEEYEEVIAFHPGVSRQCRMMMWRNAETVFVQPLVGRLRRYQSVSDALEFMLQTNVVVLTDIAATTWPSLNSCAEA